MGIFMTKNEQSNPAAEKAQDNKGNIYKNKSGILFSTKTESSMRERKAKERRRKKKKNPHAPTKNFAICQLWGR